MSESNQQKKWEREEVIILVGEYFRNKTLSVEQIDESYYKVSNFLRKREEILTGMSVEEIFRNYAGIRMQTARVRCLDPETKLSGMEGTKLQKEIVAEYLQNPKNILMEMERIYKKYGE